MPFSALGQAFNFGSQASSPSCCVVVSERLGQRLPDNGSFAWLQHHRHLQSTAQ
jgi:hypothetical protein